MDPDGDIYWQHECGDDAGIAQALGQQAPEYVVVVDKSEHLFWAIEAKPAMERIDEAVDEAREYANRINSVYGQRCAFYTGIAGHENEGHLRRTF